MFKEPRCELLGPFALVVQGSLGLIAVLSLVVKRNYEHPPRPWWIWFFDVLKQVIGAGCLHFLNLLQSIIFSNSGEPDLDKNPCTWYFLNVLLDTTIGVPVLWFFLYFVHSAAYRFGVRQIVSGQYGHPPKWIPFFKQALLYLVALVSMKLLLYLFVWWMPLIDDLGNFLISWSNFDARVQVAFVVLVFPLIMNTLQYYLVDSIIQSPEYHNPKLAQLAPDTENRPSGPTEPTRPADSNRSDLPTQADRSHHVKGKQKSTNQADHSNQANETTRLLGSH